MTGPEIHPCGCGPGDMCTECADIDRFAEAFLDALKAEIREGEAS